MEFVAFLSFLSGLLYLILIIYFFSRLTRIIRELQMLNESMKILISAMQNVTSKSSDPDVAITHEH